MGKNLSNFKAALLQTFGLISYISLVSILFWKGNEIFGKMDNYLGPLTFLTLFAVSALICGFLVFGYPFILFFQKDKKSDAITIVLTTAGLTFATLLLFMLISLF